MILSMATIILVPTGAEEIDFETLPLASTAVRGDNLNAYKIDSVAELLNTGKVLRLRGYGYKSGSAGTANGGKENGVSGDANYTIWNFEPSDVIYLTEDLDIANWDYTSVATYDEATGLYTPNWYANMDTEGCKREGSVTFEENDGSVTASSLQELFSIMYAGWSWGYSALRGYNVMCFTFDGLGHTISNYYDTHPFFRGMFMGVLKNLNFDNAYVDAQPLKDYGYYMSSVIAGGVNVPATIGWTLNDYASTMDNVHVINSTVKSYPGAKAVGIFYSESNKGEGTVNIKNSSIINCTIDCDQAYADNAGVGLVCGYLNTKVDIQNSLFLNNVIDHQENFRYKNGMLLGNTNRNGNLDYGFENVAIVGNKVIAPNVGDATIVQASNDYGKGVTATNLYVADNVCATAADGAEAPMEVLFNFHGEAKNFIEPTFSNVIVDSGVTTLMQNDAGTSVSADPAAADDTIDEGTAAGRLNATLPQGAMYWALRKDGSPTTTASVEGLPHNITFIVDANNQFTVQTDYEQAVIADAETLVFLGMNEWDAAEGKNAQPGTDWATKQNPADNTYTLIPHDVTYTPNENGTHTAYCNTCEDEIHNGTHSCVDTAPTGVFVDGGYYDKAIWEYTCMACGNVLEEVDDAATDLLPAPYAVEFEKDLYSNIDETVSVTFTAPADANLVAFTAIVTFDPKVLTYKDCAPTDPAYACIVNAAEAATGKLVVSVPSLDGTILTDAEAVLTFAFNPFAGGDTSVDAINIQSELISALVYSDEEGTQERIADVVKTTSEDVATVIFVEPNVLPGDVDNNGAVELLDAVIMLEKISGQIHESQDGNFFFIMASDVNNDGYTDRVDADLIMDYIVDGYTELVSCDVLPEVIYD